MNDPLSSNVPFDVIKVSQTETVNLTTHIATEVPLTFIANGSELATLMCTPADLKVFTTGFLFTSGFITKYSDILSFDVDETKWIVSIALSTNPEPLLMGKRLYTSGCGKGVMYASINEISLRRPLEHGISIKKESVLRVMKWFQTCSSLHKETGGVHTACLSNQGEIPTQVFDDIGRHNAVDKAIGNALMNELNLTECLLICSGRVSSEILFKAKRAGVSMIISLGSPTHQSVLLARNMNVTLIGFARGGSFTIFSHQERVEL